MRMFVFILTLLLVHFTRAFAEPAVAPTDISVTRKLLNDLIAIDTSNPPGNEMRVVEFVKPLLEEDGIEVKVLESTPGRGSLWARIRGNGKGKPFLITAHIDVVGAKKEDWKSDPFQLSERGGYLYGRGVIDDKGMAAAAIMVMKRIAREKSPLSRDLILFLGADEEAGSREGIRWVLKHHPKLIEAEVVLNEGGPILIEDGRITHAAVQSYEKIYMDVALVAEGPSGHSSLPREDNAVARLARAVANVGGYRFPIRLNTVTRAYFEGLSKIPHHPLAKEFGLLVKGPETAGYEESVKKITAEPAYNATLRTTCTPTVIKAGFRNNAIPGRVDANINCRMLPSDKPSWVVTQLEKAIGDPRVRLVPSKPERPAASPIDHPFLRQVARVMREMAPEAVTVPYMSAGATDSRKLRHRGIAAYGLLPFPMTGDDKARMHGDDERLKISSLEFGVEFLHRLVLAFAGDR